MKELIKALFYDKTKPSAKRIYGSLMFFNALIGKNLLCVAAIFHKVDNFSLIDNSLDSLLYGGLMLFAGTIIDKFNKNDKNNSGSSFNSASSSSNL